MPRKSTHRPVQWRSDRVHRHDLAHWMELNNLSANRLAIDLVVTFTTVQGWLRGYRHPPAWLEHRINLEARAVPPRLPFYGKRWGET